MDSQISQESSHLTPRLHLPPWEPCLLSSSVWHSTAPRRAHKDCRDDRDATDRSWARPAGTEANESNLVAAKPGFSFSSPTSFPIPHPNDAVSIPQTSLALLLPANHLQSTPSHRGSWQPLCPPQQLSPLTPLTWAFLDLAELLHRNEGHSCVSSCTCGVSPVLLSNGNVGDPESQHSRGTSRAPTFAPSCSHTAPLHYPNGPKREHLFLFHFPQQYYKDLDLLKSALHLKGTATWLPRSKLLTEFWLCVFY